MFRVTVHPDPRRRSTVTRYEAGRCVGVSAVVTPADVASGAVWGTLARLAGRQRTMTIVALDIDGTLGPASGRPFAPDPMAALRALLDALAPCRVVVISTWRHVPELRERADAEFAAVGIAVAWADPDVPRKGAALADWLYGEWGDPGDWPEVVIVDDQADATWLAGARLIVPNATTGLTMADVRALLERRHAD